MLTIENALQLFQGGVEIVVNDDEIRLWVVGNLIHRLRHPPLDDLGTACHQKEAIAVAVLAYESWHGRPGSLPELTGVSHPVVLGQISRGRLR